MTVEFMEGVKMDSWEEIAARFKAKIKEQGDTIREFALHYGLNPGTFRNYLSGESPNVPEEVQEWVKRYIKRGVVDAYPGD